MYITRLFKHSRVAAFCFLLFIASYIFINYKWGVVATPIYQLGMYSRVAYQTDTQSVYTLYVDDKPLSLNKLPVPYTDMLLVSLSRYEKHDTNNKAVMEVFSKYSEKLVNHPLPSNCFTNALTHKQAGLWFQQRLRAYGIPAGKLSVYSNKYTWKKNRLTPSAQEELIFDFATDL